MLELKGDSLRKSEKRKVFALDASTVNNYCIKKQVDNMGP